MCELDDPCACVSVCAGEQCCVRESSCAQVSRSHLTSLAHPIQLSGVLALARRQRFFFHWRMRMTGGVARLGQPSARVREPHVPTIGRRGDRPARRWQARGASMAAGCGSLRCGGRRAVGCAGCLLASALAACCWAALWWAALAVGCWKACWRAGLSDARGPPRATQAVPCAGGLAARSASQGKGQGSSAAGALSERAALRFCFCAERASRQTHSAAEQRAAGQGRA